MLKKSLIAIAVLALVVPAMADIQFVPWPSPPDPITWETPIQVDMPIPTLAWLEIPETILLGEQQEGGIVWWQGSGPMTVWCNFASEVSCEIVPVPDVDHPIGDMICWLDAKTPGEAYPVAPTGGAGVHVDVHVRIDNVDPLSIVATGYTPGTIETVAQIFITITAVGP